MTTAQKVIARTALQRVRTIPGGDGVVAPSARKGVGPAGSRQGQREGAFPWRAIEIARGQGRQRQIREADQAPRRIQSQNSVIDEIDIDICPFLTRDDLPRKACGDAYIQHIAQIARLEPRDGDEPCGIVDFRHEEGERIHHPGRGDVKARKARRAGGPAGSGATIVARVPAMGAGKDRISEGIGAGQAWEQNSLRLGFGQQFSHHVGAGQRRSIVESELVDWRLREPELVADQELILRPDEAQQKVIALLHGDHVRQRQTSPEQDRVDA